MFGSYRDLHYRLEIETAPQTRMRLLTDSGPGFSLEAERSAGGEGFTLLAGDPARAAAWLGRPDCRDWLKELLSTHFHRLSAQPDRMLCHCSPEHNDLYPENQPFAYCLSLLHRLLEAAPASERRAMLRSEFLE